MSENQEQQNDANKIQVNHDKVIKKLVAIVGGKDKLKGKRKLPGDNLAGIVEDLFKEEKEESQVQIKNDLKSLLKGYVDLNKALLDKENELKKLKQDKMKEFNEAASKLFNKIEGLDLIEADYYLALQAANNTETETLTQQ